MILWEGCLQGLVGAAAGSLSGSGRSDLNRPEVYLAFGGAQA